jgi:hypothetical protein
MRAQLYLSSKITKRRDVCIDRMREAPGHGKDKADGHGGTLKRFLRAWMRRHGSTTIDAKTLIESASFDAAGNALSLTSQLVAICEHEFGEGVKGGMMKKRQGAAKMRERTFDEYTQADLEAAGTLNLGEFASTNATLMTKEEKKLDLPHSTFKAYHNSRTDPFLSKAHTEKSARVMMRRWPCGCTGCKRQLEMRKFEDRYANGRARTHLCRREGMFGALNDWKNVLLKRKNVDEEDGDGEDVDAEVSLRERTDELVAQITGEGEEFGPRVKQGCRA